MTTKHSYLAGLESRRAVAEMKRQAAFGIACSSILLAIAAWKYFIVVGANASLWLTAICASVVGLAIARVAPWLWERPEAVLSYVVQKIGQLLFALTLGALYFGLVTPLGWAVRSGSQERFLGWRSDDDRPQPTWTVKVLSSDAAEHQHKRSLLRAVVAVLQHFHRRKLYWVLPFLAIVLALGMALFFVKGSALAPFIYTLF